ncbi:hypothetical protein ACNY67_06230, partial [Pantoea sp. KXB45]|uniref:hypothetical protein n=1 Tax=Pantoea sp. KXB45 TaxID=3402309 RepID=UPI003AB5233D
MVAIFAEKVMAEQAENYSRKERAGITEAGSKILISLPEISGDKDVGKQIGCFTEDGGGRR